MQYEYWPYQNDSETPEVTGLIVTVVFEDFRCSVLKSEAGGLQELIVKGFEPCKAKVNNFYL